MSNYSQITSFGPKDSLITGNPLKLVRGTELDAEFAAIATAIASKLNSTAAANPTATIGLTAVNGVLSTFMPSDAAPALSQAIAPTWTGQHIFSPATGKTTFRGATGDWAISGSNQSAAGSSYGFELNAGTNSSDETFRIRPKAGILNYLAIRGDGAFTFGNTTTNNTYTFAGTGALTVGGVYLGPDGSAGSPAYSFTNDPDTGFYRAGANDFAVTVGGANLVEFRTGSVDFRPGGVLGFQVQQNQVFFPDGLAATPGITFQSDTDTGIYHDSTNSVSIAAGGGSIFFVRANALISTQPHYFADGSAAVPSVSFLNDQDTGLYRIGANNFAAAVGGASVVNFLAAASGGAQVADLGGTLQTVGYRQVPRSTTVTTLAAGDVGKCVAITAAINIPASVFSAGDAISIYNDSAGALNITISAGTLRLAGTATTGTRSLAARGLCTLWFNVGGATPEVVASGNVT